MLIHELNPLLDTQIDLIILLWNCPQDRSKLDELGITGRIGAPLECQDNSLQRQAANRTPNELRNEEFALFSVMGERNHRLDIANEPRAIAIFKSDHRVGRKEIRIFGIRAGSCPYSSAGFSDAAISLSIPSRCASTDDCAVLQSDWLGIADSPC